MDTSLIYYALERAFELPSSQMDNIESLRTAVGPDLEEKCPKIFGMLQNKANHPRLKEMFGIAKSIKAGDVTEHDASVKVGTDLVDTFVKGKLNN